MKVLTAEGSHKDEYRKNPQLTVKVPGITTILGEFSFYCKGYTLCCANSHVLELSISPNTENIVRVLNTFTNDRKKFSVSSLKYRKEDKWCNGVKAVFHELSDLGHALGGYDITLSGKVLESDAATLTSAITVGTCLVMNEIMALGLSLDEIAMMSYKCVSSYCSELSKYSTIMAMLKAQAGKYMLFDLSRMTFRYIEDPFQNGTATALVVNCHIPPVALREELVHKHAQVRKAFDILKEKSKHSTFREFQKSELVDRVVQIGEEARRICCAVLEDNTGASSIVDLFEARDYTRIGKLCTKLGELVRDELELTCPELDWVIKRSTEVSGCYGSLPVFNGDGAYVVLVIDCNSIDRYSAKLEDYERIFGFKATFNSFTPCGAFELVR